MQNPKHIAITGASSGIGAALALGYAAPGVTLSLHGRDTARLQRIATQVQACGAQANIATGDVTDRDQMTRWLAMRASALSLDLVIANAGISAGTGGGGESLAQAEQIFAVNVNGVLNTVHGALPSMRAQRRGQIAVMASLAGFRGLPSCPTYSASKAAVRLYGEGLRGELLGSGVRVSVICPGYIRTPMTAVNNFKMPFLMDADEAAQLIKRGLAANKARIAFPFPLYATVWLLGLLPPSWTDGMLSRLPKKG